MFIVKYFTHWAFIAHAMFALGVFPNTFFLAVFVLAGAVHINVYVLKQYSWRTDVVLHYAPFLIFLWKPIAWNAVPVFMLLFAYFAYHGFDMCRLREYYESL